MTSSELLSGDTDNNLQLDDADTSGRLLQMCLGLLRAGALQHRCFLPRPTESATTTATAPLALRVRSNILIEPAAISGAYTPRVRMTGAPHVVAASDAYSLLRMTPQLICAFAQRCVPRLRCGYLRMLAAGLRTGPRSDRASPPQTIFGAKSPI